MGTDIHVAIEVEVYDEETKEARWEYLPGPIADCWSCGGTGRRPVTKPAQLAQLPEVAGTGSLTEVVATEPCYWCCTPTWTYGEAGTDDYEEEGNMRYVEPGKTRESWYGDRNYLVFAVLGDVRNGYGFAGVKTFNPVEPITRGRGLPEGVTDEALACLSHEHSTSWCTLEEVLTYDWHQPMWEEGWCDLKEYAEFIRTGRPSSWCGGVSGNDIRHVGVDQANEMLKNHVDDPNVYVNVRWQESMWLTVAQFVTAMQRVASIVGERPARLVFDFDS